MGVTGGVGCSVGVICFCVFAVQINGSLTKQDLPIDD